MLNVIDIVLAILILFYLLKNAGGILKTVKNIFFVILFLIVFAVAVRLLLDSSMVSGQARKMLEESYFVKMSTNMIAWAYPAVRESAPKIDAFIKGKIIPATTEVTAPKIELPKVTIPEKEIEKLLEEELKPAKKK
jgi:hypothetical protein